MTGYSLLDKATTFEYSKTQGYQGKQSREKRNKTKLSLIEGTFANIVSSSVGLVLRESSGVFRTSEFGYATRIFRAFITIWTLESPTSFLKTVALYRLAQVVKLDLYAHLLLIYCSYT